MNTFYEAFGIEPTEEKYCLWECKIPELKDIACNNTKCEHYRHKINYPPITLEIERKLEEIIIKFDMVDCLGFIYQELLNNVQYCAYVEFITEFANEEPEIKSGFGKTRQEALLNLCVQLKNEIKEEGKECFR